MPDEPRDNQHVRQMPPIPDGGLATSMPDWLRRPPAWRTSPDRESGPSAMANIPTLPDTDTSVIDPREFIHDDDLPRWLQSLRRPAPIAVPDSGPASVVANTNAQPVLPAQAVEESDQPAVVTVDHQPTAFRPRRPALSVTSSPTTTLSSPAVRAFATRPSPNRPRLDQRATTLALGVALVLALLVILILVVW